MAITNPIPVPCPGQPSISLDLLALRTVRVENGDNILNAAAVEISFSQYATGTFGAITGYLSPSGAPEIGYVITDLYAWVTERAMAGDNKPLQALQLITEVAVEELIRRQAANV